MIYLLTSGIFVILDVKSDRMHITTSKAINLIKDSNESFLTLFEPGDFLFVPAGVEHRFINFTDDFSTWVIFYGPKGGESQLPNKEQ